MLIALHVKAWTNLASLGDTEEALLQAALIDKHATNQYLSIHRLVQAAVMRRASPFLRVKYLDAAIQILRHIFSQSPSDVVSFLVAWTHERWVLHERCLPHVLHLIKQCKKYDIRPSNTEDLLQLLTPCEM